MTINDRRRTRCHLLALLVALISAHALAESSQLLSVDRIFHDEEFALNEPVWCKWLDDGASYTPLEIKDCAWSDDLPGPQSCD